MAPKLLMSTIVHELIPGRRVLAGSINALAASSGGPRYRLWLPQQRLNDGEDQLLAQASPSTATAPFAKVFENSLKLGTGFSGFFHTEPALEDLPAVLAQLLTPARQGTWTVLPGENPR